MNQNFHVADRTAQPVALSQVGTGSLITNQVMTVAPALSGKMMGSTPLVLPTANSCSRGLLNLFRLNRRSPFSLLLLTMFFFFGFLPQAMAECIRGDCLNGFGTFLWSSGARYDGDFQNGIRHGAGSYLFADGSLYVGEYQNGVRHGKGSFVWSSGKKYVGEWFNGRQSGFGIKTWPDGRRQAGQFKNDMFILFEKVKPQTQVAEILPGINLPPEPKSPIGEQSMANTMATSPKPTLGQTYPTTEPPVQPPKYLPPTAGEPPAYLPPTPQADQTMVAKNNRQPPAYLPPTPTYGELTANSRLGTDSPQPPKYLPPGYDAGAPTAQTDKPFASKPAQHDQPANRIAQAPQTRMPANRIAQAPRAPVQSSQPPNTPQQPRPWVARDREESAIQPPPTPIQTDKTPSAQQMLANQAGKKAQSTAPIATAKANIPQDKWYDRWIPPKKPVAQSQITALPPTASVSKPSRVHTPVARQTAKKSDAEIKYSPPEPKSWRDKRPITTPLAKQYLLPERPVNVANNLADKPRFNFKSKENQRRFSIFRDKRPPVYQPYSKPTMEADGIVLKLSRKIAKLAMAQSKYRRAIANPQNIAQGAKNELWKNKAPAKPPIRVAGKRPPPAIKPQARAAGNTANPVNAISKARGKAYKEGMKALESGQFRKAITLFGDELLNNPHNMDAFAGRGHAYLETDNFLLAISDFDRVLKVDNSQVSVLLKRAIAYREIKDYTTSFQDLSRVIALVPTSYKGYFERGLTFSAMGRLEAALRDYDKAMQRGEDQLEIYFERGRTKMKLGNYASAIIDFDHAIKREPQRAELYFERGNAHFAAKAKKLALQDYNRAISLSGDEPEYYFARAFAHQEAGQKTGMCRDLKSACNLGDYQGCTMQKSEC